MARGASVTCTFRVADVYSRSSNQFPVAMSHAQFIPNLADSHKTRFLCDPSQSLWRMLVARPLRLHLAYHNAISHPANQNLQYWAASAMVEYCQRVSRTLLHGLDCP